MSFVHAGEKTLVTSDVTKEYATSTSTFSLAKFYLIVKCEMFNRRPAGSAIVCTSEYRPDACNSIYVKRAIVVEINNRAAEETELVAVVLGQRHQLLQDHDAMARLN